MITFANSKSRDALFFKIRPNFGKPHDMLFFKIQKLPCSQFIFFDLCIDYVIIDVLLCQTLF